MKRIFKIVLGLIGSILAIIGFIAIVIFFWSVWQTSGESPQHEDVPLKTTYVPIDVSNTILNRFSKDDIELLKRHLAGTAGWRVTPENGILIAYRREINQDDTPVVNKKRRWSLNGNYSDMNSDTQRCVFIRFGPDENYDKKQTIQPFTSVAIGTKDAQLTLTSDTGYNPGDKRLFSDLRLASTNDVSLQIREVSTDPSRKLTQQMLQDVNSELANVLAKKEEIRTTGSLSEICPENHYDGPATLKADQELKGRYQIWGYVNPGEPGCVYLKAFEADTGKAISEDEVRSSTLEYIGWTTNPNKRFFFNSEMEIDRQNPNYDHVYSARLELWFYPKSGKPERKLIQTTVQLYDYLT